MKRGKDRFGFRPEHWNGRSTVQNRGAQNFSGVCRLSSRVRRHTLVGFRIFEGEPWTCAPRPHLGLNIRKRTGGVYDFQSGTDPALTVQFHGMGFSKPPSILALSSGLKSEVLSDSLQLVEMVLIKHLWAVRPAFPQNSLTVPNEHAVLSFDAATVISAGF